MVFKSPVKPSPFKYLFGLSLLVLFLILLSFPLVAIAETTQFPQNIIIPNPALDKPVGLSYTDRYTQGLHTGNKSHSAPGFKPHTNSTLDLRTIKGANTAVKITPFSSSEGGSISGRVTDVNGVGIQKVGISISEGCWIKNSVNGHYYRRTDLLN